MSYLGHEDVLSSTMDEIREEFSIVYDQYVNRIYRFVYLKVSSVELAEDLSSEVFVRVWKRLSGESEGKIDNMQAYIYQIARHVLADHYRVSSRTQIVSVEQTPEYLETEDPFIEQIDVNLEMEQVHKALGNLKDDYQNYIIWKYLDELSTQEIAQITGKSEQSVRVGIHRALQALKQELSQQLVSV